MRPSKASTVIACGLFGIAFAAPAFATAIPVTNASFEADSPPPAFSSQPDQRDGRRPEWVGRLI